MSNIHVTSILPSHTYNSLIIDHDATELAGKLQLREVHIPSILEIINKHKLTELLEPHLLHRHFNLEEGEVLVHRSLDISTSDNPNMSVDIAKAVDCPESLRTLLVPLMWMSSSTGNLVAYEYGLHPKDSPKRRVANISAETWTSFSQEFNAYALSRGIAEIISLKDKECIVGGEYVAPSKRSLFRIPNNLIKLQPTSRLLETGWTSKDQNFNTILPECTDGHVTKTHKTTHGTVADYHNTEEDGPDAFDPKEVAAKYTEAMWAAVNSENFWTCNELVEVGA